MIDGSSGFVIVSKFRDATFQLLIWNRCFEAFPFFHSFINCDPTQVNEADVVREGGGKLWLKLNWYARISRV